MPSADPCCGRFPGQYFLEVRRSAWGGDGEDPGDAAILDTADFPGGAADGGHGGERDVHGANLLRGGAGGHVCHCAESGNSGGHCPYPDGDGGGFSGVFRPIRRLYPGAEPGAGEKPSAGQLRGFHSGYCRAVRWVDRHGSAVRVYFGTQRRCGNCRDGHGQSGTQHPGGAAHHRTAL